VTECQINADFKPILDWIIGYEVVGLTVHPNSLPAGEQVVLLSSDELAASSDPHSYFGASPSSVIAATPVLNTGGGLNLSQFIQGAKYSFTRAQHINRTDLALRAPDGTKLPLGLGQRFTCTIKFVSRFFG
jgi:hypothetical protein